MPIYCNGCGRRLPDARMEEGPGEKTPCPDCGSTSRDIRVVVPVGRVAKTEFQAFISRQRRKLVHRYQPWIQWLQHLLSAVLFGLGLWQLQGWVWAVVLWLAAEWAVTPLARFTYRILTGKGDIPYTIRCGNCGSPVPGARPDESVSKRIPCPRCGSTSRDMSLVINETVQIRG